MTDSKPYVLLLGGSHDQCFIIKTAKRMGLGTVVIDLNHSSVGFCDAELSAVISTRDVPAIIAYVERLLGEGINIRGVSVMGSDIPHIVQQVSSHFDWVGPSAQTANWTTHKFAMKQRLQLEGIPVPCFARVFKADEICQQWQAWGCQKVVVKPVDQAGSRGIWCIDSLEQAEAAFYHAFSMARCGEVLVEEYVPGAQVSTESIVSGGRSATPGLVDRCYQTTQSFLPQIIENGGWYPSALPTKQLEEIISLVEASAKVLGISDGVAKGDVVVCPDRGPMLIEMAARLSGGDFSESLIPLGNGVNYVEVALQVALGLPIDWQLLQPEFTKSVINRYFFLPPGNLEQIFAAEEVCRWPGVEKFELSVQVGDVLPEITSHGHRSGVFIIVTDVRSKSEALEQKVYEAVRFKIDGTWHYGHPCRKEMNLC